MNSMTNFVIGRGSAVERLHIRGASFIATGLLGLLGAAGFMASGNAAAQTATSTGITGSNCAAERFGSDLNCTANDFTTLVTIDSPDVNSCRVGETVTVAVRVPLQAGSAVRYDGSIFFGENGPTATGDLNNLDANATCSVAAFPTSPPPFNDADGNVTNQCGDFVANGTADWRVENVNITCSPDAAGTLTVPWLLSYSNAIVGGTCDVNTAMPNTKAKCQTGTATISGMAAMGWVKVIKQTNPDGATDSFAFTATGTGATPASFNLTDGQSQIVEVPLTGGSATLNISEALTAGWNPTANIVCVAATGDPVNPTTGGTAGYVSVNNASRSIAANLTVANYGAVCTVTNTEQPPVADLEIVKTNGANEVLAGGATTYTITATNNGPSAADGAVVTDPATTGLDCTAGPLTCSASGGAACPGTLSVSALQGSGLVIPTLPNGGSVALQLTCNVTASGQ